MAMKIRLAEVEDPIVYEIMYFSPIEVGDERYTNQLYFQTEHYQRQMPVSMTDKMSAQIDQLRHVELGIRPFDRTFKKRHRDAVIFHCKMALAYLDAREARISMKLCEAADAATKSTEKRIAMDPQVDFNFLRVIQLSVMACAARRVRFYQKAVDALSEAKDICFAENDHKTHPLMTAITLLNLSAVLGDIDHDAHGLRWGLEALSMMYSVFSAGVLPETVQAYYLALACHNAALLSVKLGKWADAVELSNEGIEFTKVLNEHDDGLRNKLIAIGAQAKHVPETFLAEAVNALNGWGDEKGVWKLSFWDFSTYEIMEEIRVLQQTTTLKRLIIDHFEDEARRHNEQMDAHLARLIIAIVSCLSLEELTISGIDFDPRKVWRRIRKRSFLETSWYASALNFTNILESGQNPEVAMYKELLKNLNAFTKKLVLLLVVLGNECEGVDLSENGIGPKTITALVLALRWPYRPATSRHISTVILRQNAIDADTAAELAKTWLPLDEAELKAAGATPLPSSSPRNNHGYGGEIVAFGGEGEPLVCPSVTHLDVSHNDLIGDDGFEMLLAGIGHFVDFAVLKADTIGIGPKGCAALIKLTTTQLELLNLSNNQIASRGASVICETSMEFQHLHTLELNSCSIDASAAEAFAAMLENHETLKNVYLNHNNFGSEGIIVLCGGAARSNSLMLIHLAYNGVQTEEAAEAVAEMMRDCETLVELNLSGNRIDPKGAPHIGSAIEHSRILTMHLEDMGFTEMTIDAFLDHGAAETQDLQVMNLNGNPVGDDGVGIIAECLSVGLTDLSLSGCGLTAASQATLLNLVSLSPNLRSLDLSNNVLGPLGCSEMVRWMTQNEKENFSLRSLELGNCNLGDEGLLQLVPILGSLTYLGARSNGITSAGLEAVMNSQQMIQLKCLDLADNKIGEPGLHALTVRFQQEHKRSLWNPKQLTSMIDQVILSNNAISNSLAMSTEAYLKIHNPLLTVVW